jgi:hypothetical protein
LYVEVTFSTNSLIVDDSSAIKPMWGRHEPDKVMIGVASAAGTAKEQRLQEQEKQRLGPLFCRTPNESSVSPAACCRARNGEVECMTGKVLPRRASSNDGHGRTTVTHNKAVVEEPTKYYFVATSESQLPNALGVKLLST